MRLRQLVPLAPLTTFKIGGPAQFFTDVHTEHELREALAWARERGFLPHIIAGGSNILVPDMGLGGLTIRIAGNDFDFSNTTLRAQAGCNLLHLTRMAGDEGLGGWERMAGIPGSIGGAVRGNAGAFGTEIKDVLMYARAMHRDTEEIHEFSNAECEFAYRSSFFKRHPEWIILDVHVRLHPGKREDILADIETIIAERERRHIQNVKAAGSYFVNPVAPPELCAQFEQEKGMPSREGRVPAGWLIDKVGLKGYRVGGAEVSPQQANYIRNVEDAKAADVIKVARKVKDAVREAFHVELQEEAVIL